MQMSTPYTATFSGDAGVYSFSAYYTQDYTAADEENASSTVARDSDSGCPMVTGDGQINFTIVPAEGYKIAFVKVDGSYENLKGSANTGEANTYRITKATGILVVTITTEKTAYQDVAFSGKVGTGCMVTITAADAGTLYNTYVLILFGDVDGDSWYSGQDATIVNCIANGLLTKKQVGEAQYITADCNRDGKVSSSDVLLLEQAGLLFANVDQTMSQDESMLRFKYGIS